MSNFSVCFVCCQAWMSAWVRRAAHLCLQVNCLSLPSSCSFFCLWHICTSLLLNRLGLEDNKSSGEAMEPLWESLRTGRRAICQELNGYGCIFCTAGEWETLKDFEIQSLSSFLWFCDDEILSQWELFCFTWIRVRLYLLLWNNNSLCAAFSRTKGSTRYHSVLSNSHSVVLQ